MSNSGNVANNFSRSSKSYAMAGIFQKFAAQRLYDFIESNVPDQKQVHNVLELGCGTGFLTIGLMQLFPDAAFVISDISVDMLDHCRSNIPPAMTGRKGIAPYFERYNISEANIEKEYDLIISALAFQWLSDLDPVMNNIKARLKPGGKLIFSTLLEGTFSTLHKVFSELDIEYPGPKLLNEEELKAKCTMFDSCRIHTSLQKAEHDSIMEFLKQVQLTGAKNASGKPVSVSDMRKILRRYEELEGGGSIVVDYMLAEVVCN